MPFNSATTSAVRPCARPACLNLAGRRRARDGLRIGDRRSRPRLRPPRAPGLAGTAKPGRVRPGPPFRRPRYSDAGAHLVRRRAVGSGQGHPFKGHGPASPGRDQRPGERSGSGSAHHLIVQPGASLSVVFSKHPRNSGWVCVLSLSCHLRAGSRLVPGWFQAGSRPFPRLFQAGSRPVPCQFQAFYAPFVLILTLFL